VLVLVLVLVLVIVIVIVFVLVIDFSFSDYDYANEHDLGREDSLPACNYLIYCLSTTVTTGGFPVNNNKEQVVITVLGANKPGILAGITRTIADSNVNVEDVSQKIMQDLFALMMMTDFSTANCSFEEFQNRMQAMADQLRVKVFIQHEDVFRYQHRL